MSQKSQKTIIDPLYPTCSLQPRTRNSWLEGIEARLPPPSPPLPALPHTLRWPKKLEAPLSQRTHAHFLDSAALPHTQPPRPAVRVCAHMHLTAAQMPGHTPQARMHRVAPCGAASLRTAPPAHVHVLASCAPLSPRTPRQPSRCARLRRVPPCVWGGGRSPALNRRVDRNEHIPSKAPVRARPCACVPHTRARARLCRAPRAHTHWAGLGSDARARVARARARVCICVCVFRPFTFAFASTSALCSKSTLTVSTWPLYAEMKSGVVPFCGCEGVEQGRNELRAWQGEAEVVYCTNHIQSRQIPHIHVYECLHTLVREQFEAKFPSRNKRLLIAT